MAVALSDQTNELAPLLSTALARLGLATPPGAHGRLLGYVSLLQRWNAVHNLSAARGPVDLLQQHVVDCLAIVGPLRRHAEGRALAVLDAGTGGGLPAVVLAIMDPEWTVVAVDSVGKKTAFLRQVRGELQLENLLPRHARLEALSPDERRFDVVTSRAFSSLAEFVESTRHLIEPHGTWAAMKARLPENEIRSLPRGCQLFHVERLLVPGLDADRCLVWMKPTDGSHTH
jgi:16S rRNA (guanine527-N7)-methyltransferase